MKAKFKKGDVVLIEYKDIGPVNSLMKMIDFSLGIVKYLNEEGNYLIESAGAFALKNEYYWPSECLTLISRGEFEMV